MILCLYILLISFFPSICLVIRINLISLVTSRLDVYVVVSSYKQIGNIYNKRERNVLFNDALNTFYLRLYGVRHMVKDHSDSEKGNPLPPHRLLLSISSKCYFICAIPQTG